MKFGMPTLVELDTIEDNAKLCKKLGLQFVELNMNLPICQVSELQNIAKLENLKNKYGIEFTIHLDENINVADFNPLLAEAHLKTTLDTIEVAKELDIQSLTMHMSKGVYFSLPSGKFYLNNKYSDYYFAKLIEFRDMCTKAIGDSNIHINIENTGGWSDIAQKGINLLLESDAFGLTFDIGHNHSHNKQDEPFILERENRLNHSHFHDAIGKDNHLTLFTGEIDLKEKYELMQRNNCRCVIEVKDVKELTNSVKNLRKFELENNLSNGI